MKKLVAYCGLDCETCDARKATIENNDELRTKTAKLWSEMNQTYIPPEAINCVGCRTEGVKSPYCDSLCPIRQCAMKKDIETCGDCPELDNCTILAPIRDTNAVAKNNLYSNRK